MIALSFVIMEGFLSTCVQCLRHYFASDLRFFLVLNRTVFLFNRIYQLSMALSASGALGIRGRVAAISNFVFMIPMNLLLLFFAVCSHPYVLTLCSAQTGT